MGREVTCTVRIHGTASKGKALLETNEIIFRGGVRLKIPLQSLTSAKARNGELHVTWEAGSAVFELGDHAEKWAHAIVNPKSVLQKLGVKDGQVISTWAIADSTFLHDLRERATKFSAATLLKNSDLIFFGASESADLAGLSAAADFLSQKGALWVVYPKGKQDVRETDVLTAGRLTGLVDVKVVSFSATHTALKFVRRKEVAARAASSDTARKH